MSSQSAIPTARVNRIIKADKDVRLCSKEAVFLISKAAERMIEKTAEQSYQTARLQKRNVKMVRYEHLASVAHQPEWFYLAEVIPNSIPLSTALNLKRHSLDIAEAHSAASTVGTSASASGSGAGAGTGADFTGKRVVKSKARKSTGTASTSASGAAGGGEASMRSETVDPLATDRTTRGIKLQLPAGEGEDDDDIDEGDLDLHDGAYGGGGGAVEQPRGQGGSIAAGPAAASAVPGPGPGPSPAGSGEAASIAVAPRADLETGDVDDNDGAARMQVDP